jgi:hypothetical protein
MGGDNGTGRAGLRSTKYRSFYVFGLIITLLCILGFSLQSKQSVKRRTPWRCRRTADGAISRHKKPRVVSHRGFDVDHAKPPTATAKTITNLLHAEIVSFDLDVFWTADDSPSDLFIGHPPSMRKLCSLEAEVHETPTATMRARLPAPADLLSLDRLLELLVRHREEIGVVTLELKFPQHPDWQARLAQLYTAIRAARASDFTAVIVDGEAQIVLHERAQRETNASVAAYALLRDGDVLPAAEGREPRLREGTFSEEAADKMDGWYVSTQCAQPALRRLVRADEGLSSPVGVWVADDEPTLNRMWEYEPDELITNRPLWATALLDQWEADEAVACRTANRYPPR